MNSYSCCTEHPLYRLIVLSTCISVLALPYSRIFYIIVRLDVGFSKKILLKYFLFDIRGEQSLIRRKWPFSSKLPLDEAFRLDSIYRDMVDTDEAAKKRDLDKPLAKVRRQRQQADI